MAVANGPASGERRVFGGADRWCRGIREWGRRALTLARELQLDLLAGLVDTRQLADRAHHLPVELARLQVRAVDACLGKTKGAV